jgi:hypothetical protein
MNRRDADRLVDETADLVPQLSLSGEPLPARLPATATGFAAGEIGPGHVAVIRRTMSCVDKLERVDPAGWAEAEALLAEAATRLSPDALARVAARLVTTSTTGSTAATRPWRTWCCSASTTTWWSTTTTGCSR